jgi:squalene-hopene/tetraprenyl-beta-curcumene cyclase
MVQTKEGTYRGGSGYGQIQFEGIQEGKPKFKEAQRSDLSNSSFAAEAMKQGDLPQGDGYWKLTVEFVQKCQNSSETNQDKEFARLMASKGFKVGNDGGAFYTPDPAVAEKYGGVREEGDQKIISSYGSMTYSALKTYIYAGLKKDDPRVKALVGWIQENWDIERHPGFPYEDRPIRERRDQQGIFYYYLALARSLDAYGEAVITDSRGRKHNWAEELGTRLLGLEQKDGSWKNENPRWWEDDPVLATSYALNAINVLLKWVK